MSHKRIYLILIACLFVSIGCGTLNRELSNENNTLNQNGSQQNSYEGDSAADSADGDALPEYEPFPDGNPLNLTLELDETESMSVEIGVDGGQISLTTSDGTSFTLTIPAEALLSTETITMTPISKVDGLDLESGSVAMVDLAPNGLHFLKPANLIIDLPADPNPEEIASFSTFADGMDFHLVPDKVVGNQVEMMISHFSSPGVIRAEKYVIEALEFFYTPTQAEAYAKNVINFVYANIEDDPAREDGYRDLMLRWLNTSVLVRIKNAASNDAFIDQALGEYLAWDGLISDIEIVEEYTDFYASFESQRELYKDELATALKNAFNRAGTKCVSGKDPVQALQMARWETMASTFQAVGRRGLTEKFIKDKLKSCFNFKVKFFSQADNGIITSNVVAEIPLTVDHVNIFESRISNIGPLTSYYYSMPSTSAFCSDLAAPGELKATININFNIRYPQSIESVEGFFSFPKKMIEHKDCIVKGVKVSTDVPFWMPAYTIANRQFFITSEYRIDLVIVNKADVFAEFIFSGDAAGISVETNYDLIHTPE